MKHLHRHFLKILLGLWLLQSGTAVAEVIIPDLIPPDLVPELPGLPDQETIETEDFVSGSLITDADTVESQVQPVITAVNKHLRNIFRIFALPARGDGAGDEDRFQGVWTSYNRMEFENTFSRTAFEAVSDLLLVGYDAAIAENHLVGIAVGTESTEIDTFFNEGGIETEGLTFAPYYGWMMSDSFSLDVSLGYSDLDTDQFRTLPQNLGPPLAGTRVSSRYSSERRFTTANLNGFWGFGDFSFGARVGHLSVESEQDAYEENDGTVYAAGSLEFAQSYIGGDISYGIRSQPFFGVTLMKDSSSENVVFPSGEQPADDASSMQLVAGWRYYGDRVSAALEFSKRDGKEQYLEDSVSFTLRFNSE